MELRLNIIFASLRQKSHPPQRLPLGAEERLQPPRRQRQHLLHHRAGEGTGLRRSLQFHQPAVSRHHHVEVHVGLEVLGIAQVEEQLLPQYPTLTAATGHSSGTRRSTRWRTSSIMAWCSAT